MKQKDYNNFVVEKDREVVETDLTFVAAFGLDDKLREGVKQSIEKLRAASINTRMISGDNLHTAIACAIQAGIITEEDVREEFRCMTGEQFRKEVGNFSFDPKTGKYSFDKVRFKNIADNLLVLARSTYEDKLHLIVGLKQIGSQVAVTADGINDSAALKEANVGFCMGISGCEVAKDASDIIILDDNFNSVFKATLWGRNILDNIRKFIQFQMTVNGVCLVITFLGGATLGTPPFSVIQLLWVNMIMDTLAAISLATEPPNPNNMKLEKQKKTDKIILPTMWRNIFAQIAYQLLVLIVMLYSLPWWFPNSTYGLVDPNVKFYDSSPESTNKKFHYTMIFNTLILMNLFNQVSSRKIGWNDVNIFESFFKNKWFLIVLAAEFGFQWFVVQWGGIIGLIFRTTPLTLVQWITCLSFAVGSLLVNLGSKYVPPEHSAKFNIPFNESQGAEGDDALSKFTNKLASKNQRSETEKLLNDF
jgi:magnesium-transporting ATPase (P-type)